MQHAASKTLAWSHGSFTTSALGGMTAPVEFHSSRGKPFSPLAEAPWAAASLPQAIPGHIRGLRGVFPCLPFGISAMPQDAPLEWRVLETKNDNAMHGDGANGMWRFDDAQPESLRLVFEHADVDAIAMSSQTITPAPDRPAISFSYSAMPRYSVRLPFGFHVMLKWEDGMQLRPGLFTHGLCYPGTLQPGPMMTAPEGSFKSLETVPSRAGTLDMTRPDWPGPAEDVVMLCGAAGRFSVLYPNQRRRLDIRWDAAIMPSCLLWFSRFGLTEEPWNRRYTAIGIEPIAAAFDFLPEVSACQNPLTEMGVATSISLSKDIAFSTTLHLEALAT